MQRAQYPFSLGQMYQGVGVLLDMIVSTAKAIAVAIVDSRLDYCNSVLYGMSQANINRL